MMETRNILFNNNDNVLIISDNDLEEDDTFENEMYRNNERNTEQYQPQRQINIRFLHPNQLFHLGEGNFRFRTTSNSHYLFENFKNRMTSLSEINLIDHPELDELIEVESTTMKKISWSYNEMEKEIEKRLREQRYDLYLKVKDLVGNSVSADSLRKIFNISRQTAYNIEERKKENINIIGEKRGRKVGTKRKVNRETINFIREKIKQDPTITLNQIYGELVVEVGSGNEDIVLISLPSISKLINNMGYSYKRITREPINRNTDVAIKKRVVWGELFLQLVQDDVQFIFIDESGFNRSINRPYGHSMRGRACNIENEKIRQINNTVIGAMIVGHPMFIEVMEGPCDGNRFRCFCRNLVDWCITHLDKNKVTVVVMDNASIHRKDVFDIFWSKHIYVLKTIPYSPQTNAVEMVFAQAKAYISRVFGSHSEMESEMGMINLEEIEMEYEERMEEIRQQFQDDSEGDYLMEMDEDLPPSISAQRMNRLLDELDEEVETRRRNSQAEVARIHPSRDSIEQDKFHKLIKRAFGMVSIPNTHHYLARTIKVAHACARSYPLMNDHKFYHQYEIQEEDPIYVMYRLHADFH